ncbi:MAG: 50S ribosomal protein L22 [Euryarchaeota archaeon]|nr:50S ribosomal protein L22 [Euryarchaeota archaeon]
MVGYSYTPKRKRFSKALGREVRVSPKFSSEICREIRGKKLDAARAFLEDVMAMRRPVPLRRFNKGVAHRRGLVKAFAGRYPVKAARNILKVLESAVANAEYKGLDTDKLYISHAAAQKGRIIRGFRPRAFGRSSPSNTLTTHIEIVLEER